VPLLSLFLSWFLFVGFICTYRSYCQKVPIFNDVAGDGGVVMILRFHLERWKEIHLCIASGLYHSI